PAAIDVSAALIQAGGHVSRSAGASRRWPRGRLLSPRSGLSAMTSWTSAAKTTLALVALALAGAATEGVGSAAERAEPVKAEAAKPAVRDVTFDAVKLDMKKGDTFKKSLLTESVKKLDGKPIRIRGYILPSFQQSGIKQFVLVRDNMECCFGP